MTGDRSMVQCCKEHIALVHESRQIGSGQTGDGKSECLHSRNQQTNLTQMTIISTTVGKNPLKEME